MRLFRGASCALVIVVGIIGLIVVAALFIWQLGFIPHSYTTGHTAWWQGLLHGFFIVPNFIASLVIGDRTITLYQIGGHGWYNFWFIIGLLIALGGVLRGSSR